MTTDYTCTIILIFNCSSLKVMKPQLTFGVKYSNVSGCKTVGFTVIVISATKQVIIFWKRKRNRVIMTNYFLLDLFCTWRRLDNKKTGLNLKTIKIKIYRSRHHTGFVTYNFYYVFCKWKLIIKTCLTLLITET